MNSSFGKNLKVNIWGGSHEPEIGVDISGFPVGTRIDMRELRKFMKRRAPGSSPFATKRKESDEPVPVSGLKTAADDGENTGSILVTESPEISFRIVNKDRRSSDYSKLRNVPRPGHADYTARLRYGDGLNMAGGGPFSARMTAPLCIAGGIALQILANQGVTIGGHILSIADARDDAFSPVDPDPQLLEKLRGESMPVISRAARISMEHRLKDARDSLDSLGGVIEVCALGLPGGIGGAMYNGVESALSPILFGIPAVKGVEFGAGFDAARLTGSVNNDSFYYDENGNVKTRTNHHGGILGGITTGMPLIARVALKPTPSIGIEQDSVDLENKENTKLTVTGRHDPCVAVRAVPIVEAAVALGLLDCIYDGGIR